MRNEGENNGKYVSPNYFGKLEAKSLSAIKEKEKSRSFSKLYPNIIARISSNLCEKIKETANKRFFLRSSSWLAFIFSSERGLKITDGW